MIEFMQDIAWFNVITVVIIAWACIPAGFLAISISRDRNRIEDKIQFTEIYINPCSISKFNVGIKLNNFATFPIGCKVIDIKLKVSEAGHPEKDYYPLNRERSVDYVLAERNGFCFSIVMMLVYLLQPIMTLRQCIR